MSTDGTPSSLNSPVAILVYRLRAASAKLDYVVKRHAEPADCDGDTLGEIVITREVAHEIDRLYCLFSDHLARAGLLQNGPLIDQFPEQLPPVLTDDEEQES